MKEKKTRMRKIQSNKGFTMADISIAIICFTIFVGIMGSLFYSVYKINLQTRMTSLGVGYAIQILEDIDKVSYDEVVNDMENEYKEKFSIPNGYDINLDVTNYNEGTDKQDLIKQVKLTINYKIAGDTEKLIIQKVKIREK